MFVSDPELSNKYYTKSNILSTPRIFETNLLTNFLIALKFLRNYSIKTKNNLTLRSQFRNNSYT